MRLRLLVMGWALLAAACPNPNNTGDDDAGPPAEPPRIYVTPPFGLGFDCVLRGCMQTQSFTVTNNGGGIVRIQRVTLTMDTSDDFKVVSDSVLPVDVSKDQPATFGIKYVPSDAVPDTGSVRISYTLDPQQGPDPEPVELPLRTRTLGSPHASLPSNEVNFGYVAPGDVETRELVIENAAIAGSVLTIDAAELEDGSDTEFRVLTPLPLYANSGMSVTMQIRFAPTLDPSSARTFRGVLHMATNDSAVPDLAVSLLGTGRSAPQISVEPETVASIMDLGSVGVGGTTTETLYVRNTGGGNLVVIPTILNGMGAGFTTQPAVGQLPIIGAFERQPLVVNFTAMTGGPALGEAGSEPILQLQSNDPQVPVVNIRLKGFGVLPNAQPDVDRVDFGNIVTGWVVEPRTVSVRNTGAGPLHLTDVFLELGSNTQYRLAAVTGLPTTLLPEDPPFPATVHFAPVIEGSVNGVLVFQTDDPDEPLKRVPITGRGTSCEEGCPVPNATPSCLAGFCEIGSCDAHFHDANEKDGDGCECREDDGGDVGFVCNGGERNLGTCSDNGCDIQVQGTLHSETDEDLYWVFTLDEGGVGQVFGDDYDVNIDFVSAPPGVEFCVRHDSHDVQGQGCGRGTEECGRRSIRQDGSYGSDDNRDFTIKVRFTPGTAPFCAGYTLRVRNG